MRGCMRTLMFNAVQADTEDLLSLFGGQDAASTGQSQTPVIGEQRRRTYRRLKGLQRVE